MSAAGTRAEHRRTESPSGRKRRAILDAAERVFLRAGFLGTNMDQVAAEAGVAKQTLYAHFGSKEALFLTLVSAMTDRASDDVQGQTGNLEPDVTAEQVLLDYADRQLAVVLTTRLLQLRRLVIGEVERFPDLARALYEAGPARAITALAQIIEGLSERREISVPDAREAATQFNWLVMGGPLNEAMLLGVEAIPTDTERRAHAQRSVQLFLSAYRLESDSASIPQT
ncbi:MAG TPA: TetR/AcrR family transcriptional regulator [Beutenbergiaceae bacterium]|nr:TetR/AcrR family transcriptional regulator [Beutenbergiaceae bacterium]